MNARELVINDQSFSHVAVAASSANSFSLVAELWTSPPVVDEPVADLSQINACSLLDVSECLVGCIVGLLTFANIAFCSSLG